MWCYYCLIVQAGGEGGEVEMNKLSTGRCSVGWKSKKIVIYFLKLYNRQKFWLEAKKDINMYEIWGRCVELYSFMILPCISCTPYYKHGYHPPHLWSRYITVLPYISYLHALPSVHPLFTASSTCWTSSTSSCIRSIARFIHWTASIQHLLHASLSCSMSSIEVQSFMRFISYTG